jgi:uncharacterized protein (DUF2147 family)
MLRRISGAVILAFAGAGAALADPTGTWREKDGGTIQVSHCGEGYCATIATVQPPLDPATGRPWTDKQNADPTKRSRPLVGVQVLTAPAPAGPGKWSGSLYDSDRGTHSGGQSRGARPGHDQDRGVPAGPLRGRGAAAGALTTANLRPIHL